MNHEEHADHDDRLEFGYHQPFVSFVVLSLRSSW
jgi:hypothetical protein